MKQRRHWRKETFSVLLVSNTGRNNRHFHVSVFFLRLFIVCVLVVCVSFGWLVYRYVSGNIPVKASVKKDEATDREMSQTELLAQIEAKEEQIRQLEEEKVELSRQNDALTSENKALFAAARINTGADGEKTEDELTEDPAFPSLYPYSKMSVVVEKFADSHPYVSIDLQEEGDVIAAGNGMVSMVGSDDEYPLIIEIEHGNGYRTRYMFQGEAQSQQEEGKQIEAGAVLVSLDESDIQMDYQVMYENEPMDPMIVFEAKG